MVLLNTSGISFITGKFIGNCWQLFHLAFIRYLSRNIKELCGLILMENNCMATREEFREKSVNLRNIPLSCWTSPLSIFSSFFNVDNSASSLVIACFAFSTSFFLIMAPSWYAAIFFFSWSMASLEASQQVFGQFTLPSYSSVPSQQSPHCKQKKYRKKKKTPD